jgi:anti-anti-sigma factor
MEITISDQQGRVPVTVLHVKGKVTAQTADQLQAQAQQAHDDGARDMLIDLADVELLSSSGLRALHNIFNMMRGDSPEESDQAIRKGLADGSYKSPHLKLLKPQKHVREALKMTGYDMFLEIHGNLKDAIASV